MLGDLILAAWLAAIVAVGYQVNAHNPVCAPVLFALPFLAAVVNGLTNYELWEFSLSINTILVVGISGSLILFASILIKKLIRGSWIDHSQSECCSVRPLHIPVALYVIGIVISIITVPLLLSQMESLVIAYNESAGLPPRENLDGFLSVINAYEVRWKFTDFDMSIRGLAGQLRVCVGALCFVWVYILIYNLLAQPRKFEWPAFANLLIGMGVTLLTGGRAGIINYAISALVIYCMLKTNQHARILTPKTLGILLALLVSAIALFRPSLALIGREASGYSLSQYIGIYLGAPLKNYDSYVSGTLSSPGIPTSDVWGEASFSNFATSLSHWFGVEVSSHVARQPYQTINGQDLGNVYTGLMSPTLDWGPVGAIFYYFVWGLVIQWCYEKCISHGRHIKSVSWTFDLANLAYGFIAYNLMFTFFSNWLGESVVNTGFFRNLIIWGMVMWVIRIVQPNSGKFEKGQLALGAQQLIGNIRNFGRTSSQGTLQPRKKNPS